MALSKTHLLILGIALKRINMFHKFGELAPLVILPDAIRCFKFGENIPNNRVISHFEINPHTGEASWMSFPSKDELKVLSDEIVQNLPMHMEETYDQVAIGDETCVLTFLKHNEKLDFYTKLGITCHLIQDRTYDAYIREKIDCSKRHTEQLFYFNGSAFNPKEVRKLISEIEEQEFQLLAKLFEQETGITPDQKWFEENVKTVLDSTYSPKMAETTWKYISVNIIDNIPKWLSDEECSTIIEKMVDNTIDLLKS